MQLHFVSDVFNELNKLYCTIHIVNNVFQEKVHTKNQQPLEYAIVDKSKKKKDDKQEKVRTYICT